MKLFYSLAVQVADFLRYVVGRKDLHPAAAGEQVGEKVGGGSQTEFEIDVVVGLIQQPLRGVQREVAQGETLVAISPQDDAREWDARVGHHPEVFGKKALRIEVGVDGERLVGEREGGDAVETQHHQAFAVATEEVPAAAEEFYTIRLHRPLGVVVAAVTTVAHHDTDAALHGLHHLTQKLALGGDVFEQDAVVKAAGLTYIADGQRAEHPLLDAVGAQLRGVDDIVAVVGVAADGDAENLLDGRTVAVEGGAAEGCPLAEVGELPAVAEVGQRDAPRPPDGVHQPDILLEKRRCFHRCKD